MAALVIVSAAEAIDAQTQSPAQQRMAAAERAVAVDPKNHQAYNELAMALARRARETADPLFYARAQEAIEGSLKLAPDNFEAL
jgi:hypothetical protein